MITFGDPLASWLLLAGRVAMAAVFLVSAIHKLVWYRKAVAEFRREKIPLIAITLPGTILLQTFASAFLVAGVFVAEAALALAAFTIVATIKVHHFWTMQGQQRLDISRVALANAGIVGGLLVLAAASSGELS
jgi:putative oxidoreductase